MKTIYIYSGPGVGTNSDTEVPASLAQEISTRRYSIKRIDAKTILAEKWRADAALLVMPGGRDVPYQEALVGKANSIIREYVSGGGKYLGLCAGAYYASSSFEFDAGGELEIIASRELGFFPGKAIGPAYGVGSYFYNSERGTKAAPLEVASDFQVASYFSGGCYFLDSEKYPTVEVLARYSDIPGRPAAIIQCAVGKGMAILTGVHPEFRAAALNVEDSYLVKILPELKQQEPGRRRLLRELLQRVGLELGEV